MSRKSVFQIIKDWMLVICMVVGAGAYLIYHDIPSLHSAGPVLLSICKRVQPLLLFMMLFLSFCKIEPRDLRPHRWQAWLLLIQLGFFAAFAGVVLWAMHSDSAAGQWIIAHRIAIESCMLCLICPTATACAVVTGKLGGNMAEVVTYTVIINLAVALAVPAVLPLLYPTGGMSFSLAFSKILAKVFPLLIMPCITAWLIRYLLPKVHDWFLKYTHWSFYIWCVALTLAILMSTRAIVQSGCGIGVVLSIALGSLAACIFQFWAGKRIGARYGCTISAGQALGQKNTVLAIWIGYTFMDPILSVAGGLYSIWHNIYNSWQLYRHRIESESAK